jgi:hypothetical protein
MNSLWKTILCLLVAFSAHAQTQKKKVLVVPIQGSQYVLSSVIPRLEEYFGALLEIDQTIQAVKEEPATHPEHEQKTTEPEQKVKPQNRKVLEAHNMAEQGKKAILAKRYEQGLTKLLQAEKVLSANLNDLEDFEWFVDVLLWKAYGFYQGGYREEAAPAIKNLVTLRPDLSPAPEAFGKDFCGAVENAKRGIVKGGDLVVSTNVPDSVIFVDGKEVGKGEQKVQGLAVGRHFVKVVEPSGTTIGRFVQVTQKEQSQTFAFKVSAPKPKKPTQAKPLSYYASSGDFSQAFADDAKTACDKMGAQFAMLGYVARSDTAYHFGVFLFDANTKTLLAVEPAVIDLDLSNLQIALLELEARASRVISDTSPGQVVSAKPPIYALAPSQPQAQKPKEAPVVAPAPSPASPAIEQQASQPSLPPPPQKAQPAEVATGGFEEIPPDFPIAKFTPQQEKPWYKKWWVWTAVGGVAAVGLGVGLGIKYGRSSKSQDTFGATISW